MSVFTTNRARLLAVLGGAAAILCIVLVTRGIDWNLFFQSIAHVRWFDFALGVLFYCSAKVNLAFRWSWLLKSRVYLSVRDSFGHIMIAYLINNALPFRGGEAARLFLAHRKNRVSVHFYLGAMLIERTMDALLVLGLVLALGALMDVPSFVRNAIFTASALSGFVCILVFFLPARPIAIIAARLPAKAASLLSSVHADLQSSFKLLGLSGGAAVVFFTLASWGSACLAFYFWQVSFQLAIPWFAGALVMIGTTLATAFVSTPGGIGLFHQAAMGILSLWAVDRSIALGFAASTHVVHLFIAVLFGLIFMLVEHVSWRGIRTIAEGRANG